MAKKTNARPITFRKPLEPDKQKLACYPQDIAGPAVSETPVLPDRKFGVEKYRAAESPENYKARMNGQIEANPLYLQGNASLTDG